MTPTPRSILVAGATGLVGHACMVRILADPSFSRVIVPTRRPLPPEIWGLPGAHRMEERILDFDRLGGRTEHFDVDQVVCALGTTLRKAGSKEAFRRVDLEYPVEIGRLARAAGARHYLLVSAAGADPASRIFYNRVKGETEREIGSLGFPSLTILRPSLLMGPREEFRLGEELARKVRFLLPRRLRPVHRDTVAGAIVAAALRDEPGTRVLESPEIEARA